MPNPIKNGGEMGRDSKGHFLPGNKGGPGRKSKADTLSAQLDKLDGLKLPKKLPPTWAAALVNWRRAGFPMPKTVGELIAVTKKVRQLDGDYDADRENTDRQHGKARQAVELSGPNGGPTDIHYDARIVSPLAEAGK